MFLYAKLKSARFSFNESLIKFLSKNPRPYQFVDSVGGVEYTHCNCGNRPCNVKGGEDGKEDYC